MEEEMVHCTAQYADKGQEKKPRKRLKRLCGQIREQVEFYFSDANLQKDRYLKGQVHSSPDGYIDLEIISNFNRLKAITEDMKLVAKALTTSKLIDISEDGKKIRRKKALKSPEDTDTRTIYVECLPPGVDHEWVKNVFRICGNVVYVSLPKFKTTGDLKGFGFVEFETKEGAEKACEEMNNPPDNAPQRPGMFPKTSKQLKQLQKQVAFQMPELLPTINICDKETVHPYEVMPNLIPEEKITDGSGDRKKKEKKRKSHNSGSSVEDENNFRNENKVDVQEVKENDKSGTADLTETTDKRGAKRKKTPLDENNSPTKRRKPGTDSGDENTNIDKGKDETKPSRKRCNKEIAEEDEKEVKRVRISEQVTVKKIEKKKRKGQKKKKGKDLPELRVISKKQWLHLKHEYLSIQKLNMNTLKNALKKQTEEKMNKKTNNSSKPMEFVSDVIVKINSSKSTTRKTIKDLLSMVGEVAYVDFQDGDSSGYIRCVNGENARQVADAQLSDMTLEMVTGTEEKRYWEKIFADRDRKLNQKTKSKPKRKGKQKLLDKVEKRNCEKAGKVKHIMFDDD